MKRKLITSLSIITTATAVLAYETFNDGLYINTNAVPLTFSETDNSGSGAQWRVPLDGGTLRFDVSTSGYFSTYVNPLALKPDGKVGIGTMSPQAKLHVKAEPATGDTFIFEGDNSSDGVILTVRASNGAFPLLQLENNYINSVWNIENGRYGSGDLTFYKGGSGTKLIIDDTGNVGIGTVTPTHKLSVNGTVRAKEVIVDTGWADFVFEESYTLRSLGEVEDHIKEHGHLPGIPSAAVVESEGLSVGEAQKIMMQKIEELTLYMIEQEKKNQAQQREIEDLREQLSQQNARYNSE